eukprot:gene8024-12489_t
MEKSLFVFDKLTSHVQFEFFSVAHDENYLGLGFSSTSHVTNDTIILIYKPPNTFFEMKNHFEKKNNLDKRIFINVFPIQQDWKTKMDNYDGFFFQINNTFLKNQKYIFLTQYSGNANLSLPLLPEHQHLHIYRKSILNTTLDYDNCGPEHLRPYRIFINGLQPIGYIRFIITILLFLIMVYYRNSQPLKSRNYGPHYICLVQLIEYVWVTIRNANGIEFEVRYQCVSDGLVSFPMLFMLSCVVLSYYARYIVVNNLGQQKKVYADGKLPLIYVFLATPAFIISALIQTSYTIIISILDIGFILALVVSGVFPLLLTIIKHFTRFCRRSPKINYNDLELIIQDPGFLQSLITFSEKEYSPENIQFRLDLQNYLKASPNQRNNLVHKIDTKYLRTTSPYEINLDGRSLKEYRAKLESCTINDDFTDDLFDEIERTIYIF